MILKFSQPTVSLLVSSDSKTQGQEKGAIVEDRCFLAPKIQKVLEIQGLWDLNKTKAALIIHQRSDFIFHYSFENPFSFNE